jgi:pyruvate dehydrogenase E1 component
MKQLKASEILEKYGIGSEVWSVTSFNLLRKNGMEIERINQLNPLDESKLNYVEECFIDNDIPTIAATDYMRAYAEQIRPYISGQYATLGTDGYGRSDSRKTLRGFFEVDSESITRSAIYLSFSRKFYFTR